VGHPLERIYPYVPVWAQNLGITLYGLKYRRERLGGRFDEHVRGFQQRDRCSQQEMQSYVDSRLRSVLTLAFDQVPYYRRKWQAAGLTRSDVAALRQQDLSRLPFTPKADLRKDPEEFLAGNIAKRKLHRYYSSGSTGTPIQSIYSTDAHRHFFAAREVRSFGWAGSSMKVPRSMLGGRMIVPSAQSRGPVYRYNLAERQVYFTAYHLSPRNVPSYVEGLNRYRPSLLTGYAYSHYLLARLMLDQGLKLDYQPQAIVLSSEKLTPEMKIVIRQAFGARAYEEYGAVEQCALATECEHGSLHVNSDFGIVEILDDEGKPVPPGVDGRLVCTGLINDAQPLIRYDIGDIGAWSENACPCGRNQLPVLKDLVGRLEDAVIGPDGTEMVRFHGIFVGMPNVLEGQIVQQRIDLLRVRVVVTDGFGPEDEKAIRHRITKERLHGMNVEIERVPELERTDRRKFRAVISMLTPEQRSLARANGRS
jgi:phenylacetate-coenzyme A ligase PaaK-like adenylate-forming protein